MLPQQKSETNTKSFLGVYSLFTNLIGRAQRASQFIGKNAEEYGLKDKLSIVSNKAASAIIVSGNIVAEKGKQIYVNINFYKNSELFNKITSKTESQMNKLIDTAKLYVNTSDPNKSEVNDLKVVCSSENETISYENLGNEDIIVEV